MKTAFDRRALLDAIVTIGILLMFALSLLSNELPLAAATGLLLLSFVAFCLGVVGIYHNAVQAIEQRRLDAKRIRRSYRVYS